MTHTLTLMLTFALLGAPDDNSAETARPDAPEQAEPVKEHSTPLAVIAEGYLVMPPQNCCSLNPFSPFRDAVEGIVTLFGKALLYAALGCGCLGLDVAVILGLAAGGAAAVGAGLASGNHLMAYGGIAGLVLAPWLFVPLVALYSSVVPVFYIVGRIAEAMAPRP